MKIPDHPEVSQVFRNSHHQPLLHLARETLTPILIVEGLSNSILFVLYSIIFTGIIIFEDSKISQLCDMKYFIEIDKGTRHSSLFD